ncbi:MAG TPA: TMEM175 family protein [Ktedonobacterales bacterium]|nr:TMEM175 family protein [Ktedonobacterales bacterium]
MARIEKPPLRTAPKGEVATESESKALGRLEAFSDGVFAIAITLLVLEIQIPRSFTSGQLMSIVDGQWSSFIAYLVSFLTILVMWLNHHNIVQFIRRADRLFFVLNGLLLMMITFLNYPTALAAEATHSGFANLSAVAQMDQRFAAQVYTGTMVIIAALYNALWFSAIARRRLVHPKYDQTTIRIVTIQYSFGVPLYIVAFLLALIPPVGGLDIGPFVSLLLTGALAVYFAFTGHIGEAPTRVFPPFDGFRGGRS